MTDFEGLGVFYLGKRYDLDAHVRTNELVLYDAKDLTTHAVIIGMTGSGKTGLGIGLLEEALLDRIPVIAIDPKGDLGNLALRFPSLMGSDFAPWVDPQQAENEGRTVAQFADETAQRWRDGLAEWGEDAARIARLREAADIAVYTPGSTAGRPLSVLRAFDAPPPAIRDDPEAFRERVDATTTGLLSLLGVDADGVTGREHILIASLLSNAWTDGRNLDLAALIGGIQSPPFAQIGVMPVDTVFPPKDRLDLALRLNNLLASPGFQSWMRGEPLDTASLLHDASGKPRGSVISIAHLDDAQRMFFMTLLLADVLAWTRTQPGTGSLRAILYIDELFGYMPPVANPPSKPLLLTLLKQARAFGVGVVLASQNPVDLDYRGLSNAGTWFIGRLQTERDKARVMEGLEGAARGGTFDRGAMEQTIAGLGKRVFLMNSVHESAPVTFETRWTMSYLAGPMTREQIKRLGGASPTNGTDTGTRATSDASATIGSSVSSASTAAASATPSNGSGARAASDPSAGSPASPATSRARPVLTGDIVELFMPTGERAPHYSPKVLAVADVSYASAKLGVNERRRIAMLASLDDGPIALDWDGARSIEIDPAQLERAPDEGSSFDPLPKSAGSAKSYAAWSKSFVKHVAANECLELHRSPSLGVASDVGESERAFRIRLQVKAREERDAAIAALRARYAPKLATMTDRVRRAEQAVAREESQASQARLDSVVSIGGAIFGAVFGRGKVGVGTIGKVGTAARGVGRAAQQRADVSRAGESLQAVREAQAGLERELQDAIDELGGSYDASNEALESVSVKAKTGDVQVQLVALLWVPRDADLT